jgi:hypothetical protein
MAVRPPVEVPGEHGHRDPDGPPRAESRTQEAENRGAGRQREKARLLGRRHSRSEVVLDSELGTTFSIPVLGAGASIDARRL